MSFVRERDVHFATLHLLPSKTGEICGPGDAISGYAFTIFSDAAVTRELDRCRDFNRDIATALNFIAENGHVSGAGRPAYLSIQHGENAHVEHDPC